MVWLAVHLNPNDVQALMNVLENEDEDDNNDNQDSRDVIIDEDIGNMDVSNQSVNNDGVENMLLDDQLEHLNNQDFQNAETRDGLYVVNSVDNTENPEEPGAAVEVSIGIKEDEEGSLPGPSRKMPSRREEQNLEDEEFRWWDEFAEISIASSSDYDSDIPLFYHVSKMDETQYQPANSIKVKDNAENPDNIFHIINNDFAQSSSNIDLAADECAAESKTEDVKQKVEHSLPGRSRKRPRVNDEDENGGRKKQRKRKHLQ